MQIRPIYDNLHKSSSPNFNKIWMCAPPKSGTTSWQESMLAMEMNTTIDQIENSKFFNKTKGHIYGGINRLSTVSLLAELLSELENYGDRPIAPEALSIYAKHHRSECRANKGNLSPCGKISQILKIHEKSAAGTIRPHQTVQAVAEQLFVKGKAIKYMNARHPLARLYSCWGDKMNYWQPSENMSPMDWQVLYLHNNATQQYALGMWNKTISKHEDKKTLEEKSDLSAFSFTAFIRH